MKPRVLLLSAAPIFLWLVMIMWPVGAMASTLEEELPHYTIRQNQTISHVAQRCHTSTKLIVAVNRTRFQTPGSENQVQVGASIVLPAPSDPWIVVGTDIGVDELARCIGKPRQYVLGLEANRWLQSRVRHTADDRLNIVIRPGDRIAVRPPASAPLEQDAGTETKPPANDSTDARQSPPDSAPSTTSRPEPPESLPDETGLTLTEIAGVLLACGLLGLAQIVLRARLRRGPLPVQHLPASPRRRRGIFAASDAVLVGGVGTIADASFLISTVFTTVIAEAAHTPIWLVLLTTVVGNVLVTLVGGVLGDAYPRHRLMYTALLIGAIGAFAAAAATSPWLLVPAILAVQVTGQAPYWLLTLGQDRLPSTDAGQFTGRATRIWFFGMALCIAGFGFVADESIRYAWALFGVLLLAVAEWARRAGVPDTMPRTPVMTRHRGRLGLKWEVLFAPINALRQDMRGLAAAWATVTLPLVIFDSVTGVIATQIMGLPVWVVGVSVLMIVPAALTLDAWGRFADWNGRAALVLAAFVTAVAALVAVLSTALLVGWIWFAVFGLVARFLFETGTSGGSVSVTAQVGAGLGRSARVSAVSLGRIIGGRLIGGVIISSLIGSLDGVVFALALGLMVSIVSVIVPVRIRRLYGNVAESGQCDPALTTVTIRRLRDGVVVEELGSRRIRMGHALELLNAGGIELMQAERFAGKVRSSQATGQVHEVWLPDGAGGSVRLQFGDLVRIERPDGDDPTLVIHLEGRTGPIVAWQERERVQLPPVRRTVARLVEPWLPQVLDPTLPEVAPVPRREKAVIADLLDGRDGLADALGDLPEVDAFEAIASGRRPTAVGEDKLIVTKEQLDRFREVADSTPDIVVRDVAIGWTGRTWALLVDVGDDGGREAMRDGAGRILRAFPELGVVVLGRGFGTGAGTVPLPVRLVTKPPRPQVAAATVDSWSIHAQDRPQDGFIYGREVSALDNRMALRRCGGRWTAEARMAPGVSRTRARLEGAALVEGAANAVQAVCEVTVVTVKVSRRPGLRTSP